MVLSLTLNRQGQLGSGSVEAEMEEGKYVERDARVECSGLVHDPEDDLLWEFDGHLQPRFQITGLIFAILICLFSWWLYWYHIHGELK